MPPKPRQVKMENKSALAAMQRLESRSDEELEAETRFRAAAQAILGARAAERMDAKRSREHFRAAIAAARPQERLQLRRMAEASLALAERRPADLKAAAEKLGQTPPTNRQLLALRFIGIVAPPPGASIFLRIRGILLIILLVIALLALGWGIIQLVSLPFGGIDKGVSIFWGFLLVCVVLGVLFLFGRRRQKRAREKQAEQRAQAATSGRRESQPYPRSPLRPRDAGAVRWDCRVMHSDTTPTGMVELTDVTRVFGRGDGAVNALDGVTLSLRRGTFTAIMGPSGSGKSTLLQSAAGLDRPTSGRVRLGEHELTELGERALAGLRRERIGFVFQSFNLLGALTAEQNVSLPSRLAGKRLPRSAVRDVLERVGLGERARHRPAQLSGGQQQRVAIARALVGEPDVIFADEPTGALDSRSGRSVLELLRRTIDDGGRTLVMVTHDPSAAAWADRVVFMADGRLAGELTAPTAEQVAERLTGLGA